MASKNKKFIIYSFICICLSSCDWLWPFGEDLDSSPSSYMEWRLRNTTEEKLVLYSYYDDIRMSMTIPQYADTLLSDYSVYSDMTNEAFGSLWDGRVDSVAVQMNLKIISVWRKSEKNNPGKQFFKESSWTKDAGTREDKPCDIWTFEILPEDIE